MSIRNLVFLRRLSTTRISHRPALSADYKSKQIWEERFNCPLLSSESGLIKTINNKIISGAELNNLEIDVFINIAAPRRNDISQLQEAATSLRRFRKTIYANTMLPSTSHALCRLFLDSEQLDSLVSLLEKRIEFGIFHEPFSLNLLFDAVLEQKNYALGCRLASLIMLQEEFGNSQLNDNFSLYALAKYTESKTDFRDWCVRDYSQDPIFKEFDAEQLETLEDKKDGEAAKKEGEDNDDQDEDEVEKEYVRIPFLRNFYFDNHFDLTDPRLICGKALSMLGLNLEQSQNDDTRKLAAKCKLIANVLQAHWQEAQAELDKCVNMNVSSNSLYKGSLKHYVENIDNLDKKPSDNEKVSLISGIDKLLDGGLSLSEEAEVAHEKLRDTEKHDIERLKADLSAWSKARLDCKQRQDDIEKRAELIAEIKAKKEELKLREQYLYFYDNLRKTNLTRIEYD